MDIRAPGRICLFGEHQDYLGYPVIAAAIDRYIFINATPRGDSDQVVFEINTPDLVESIPIEIEIPNNGELLSYESNRDYLRSGINVALKEGVTWTENWEITITGNIPINAGASSSSALVIAWLKFLFAAGKRELKPDQCGTLGYQTEVAEFNEAGGMMDHFASSVGNLIYVESIPKFKATSLPAKLGGFVLANSGIKKNTVDDLKRVKALALSSFDHIKEIFPKFDRFKTPLNTIEPYLSSLDEDEQKIAYGNLVDRELTQSALKLLKDSKRQVNSIEFGKMISRHHDMLSTKIGVSIPVIDEMVEMAIKAGAYGAKINGSGFGGTMFAYAPNRQDAVVDILTEQGFDCWPIQISPGAEISNE